MKLPSKWKVVKNEYTGYKEHNNLSYLTEDMFQATSENIVIDSGWYGNCFDDEKGAFITFLVKDNNWEQPLIKIQSSEFKNVFIAISLCVKYMEEISNGDGNVSDYVTKKGNESD